MEDSFDMAKAYFNYYLERSSRELANKGDIDRAKRVVSSAREHFDVMYPLPLDEGLDNPSLRRADETQLIGAEEALKEWEARI